MTTIDWIIIAIITLSTVMSLWRGATREIFSLITWVAAIYLGVKFAGSLDGLFAGFIDSQSVRFAVGFIVIVLLIMIVGGLLSKLLGRFINFTGLTVVDRLLGIFFGAARGVLILAIGVVLGNYTTLPQETWWKESQLLPQLESMAGWLSHWVQQQGFDTKKLEAFTHSIEGGEKEAAKPTGETTAPNVNETKPEGVQSNEPANEKSAPPADTIGNILDVPAVAPSDTTKQGQ